MVEKKKTTKKATSSKTVAKASVKKSAKLDPKVAKIVKAIKVERGIEATKATKATKPTKVAKSSVKTKSSKVKASAKSINTTPNKKHPRIILFVIVFALIGAIIGGALTLLPCCKRTKFAVVAKDNTERVILKLEIADNDPARLKGLMGRENIPANTGMLFDFEEPGDYSMWMKDTIVPLDMVFLNNNSKVIALAPNRKPMTEDLINPCSIEYEHALRVSKKVIDEDEFYDKCEPRYEQPNKQTRYVIELPAGTIKANNIRIGDILLKK